MLMEILKCLLVYLGTKLFIVLSLYLACVYYDDDDLFKKLLPIIYFEFVAVYKLLKRLVNKFKKVK